MSRIFINYRRSDTPAHASRIYEWLSERYGEEAVFIDVDAVEPGLDFVDAIDRAVGESDVVIILIGRRWVVDVDGRRRLHEPEDYVRLEIEAALANGKRIIPILVEGADMPEAEVLPQSLQPLTRRNAFALTDERWRYDRERLLRSLDAVLGASANEPKPPAEMEKPRIWPKPLQRPDRAPVGASPPAPPPKRAKPRLHRFFPTWQRFTRRSERSQPSAAQLAEKRDEGRAEPVRGPFDRKARSASDLPAELSGDIVDCTVFAPSTSAPGDTVFVQVFAHLAAQSEDARAHAEEFDTEAERRAFKTLEAIVRRGSTLLFDLRMSRLTVIDPVQSLVWTGRAESVQFQVDVPKDVSPGTDVGTVTVSLDSVPIGHIKFKLAIVPASTAQTAASEPVGDDAKRYATAFVSYSSKDRAMVLKRVQMLKPLGIDYFQDVLDLDPGDRWERKIYLNIDECDLFLLFWSSDAKMSPWVRKEVRYALERKGDDDFAAPEIRPVIIEGPPIPLPWPELAHLHFGDNLMYVMAGLDS